MDWNLSSPKLTSALQQIATDPKASLIDLLFCYKMMIEGDVPVTAEQLHIGQSIVNSTSIRGLDYLPASTRTDIPDTRLTSFDWSTFYREYYGGAIIENIRAELSKAYDFVLVVSEKGFTEAAGISTIQLADVIALMINLNTQALEKSIQLARRVNTPGVKKDGRQVKILPIPSRLPIHEPALREQLYDMLESGFSKYIPQELDVSEYYDSAGIPETSQFYFYENKIFALVDSEENRFSMTRSYKTLSRYLVDIAKRMNDLPKGHESGRDT